MATQLQQGRRITARLTLLLLLLAAAHTQAAQPADPGSSRGGASNPGEANRSRPGEAKGLVREGAAAALHNDARRVAARAHALGHVLAAHLQGNGSRVTKKGCMFRGRS